MPTRTEPTRGPPSRTTTDPLQWAPPPPTPADLARQVRDVIADVPRSLTAPLLRSWHLHWGASPAEVAERMPGDDLFPRAQYRSTRAITIVAPPDEVWPWLVQVGCLRAGWYSDDLLDDLAHPSAREVVPELQDLQVGRWLPMKSFSIRSCDTPCSFAILPKKSTTPSERVGPGSTALTVTPLPATDSARPRDSASCAVLVTP